MNEKSLMRLTNCDIFFLVSYDYQDEIYKAKTAVSIWKAYMLKKYNAAIGFSI